MTRVVNVRGGSGCASGGGGGSGSHWFTRRREDAKTKGAKDLGSRGGAEGAEEKKKEMVGFDGLSPNGVGRMNGPSVQLLTHIPIGLSSSKPPLFSFAPSFFFAPLRGTG